MKHRGWLFIFLLLALVPAGALAQGQAEWTILYYSAADNDLEAFMIGDLVEMHLVGSTDDVNIVMQMDRTPGYDEVNGNFEDTRRFYVEQATNGFSGGDFAVVRQALLDRFAQLDPGDFGLTQAEWDEQIRAIENATDEEIEGIVVGMGAPPGGGADPVNINLTDLEIVGEVETGTPEALVDFATWGISAYPAEKYMLILSNHGGGWTGIAFDETSDNDGLNLNELESALEQIVSSTGIGQFELVAFDACLMGQLEVYATLAPYARYTIASQEVIPGAGWEYVTPLRGLVANPQMDMTEFGKLVIDGYMEYYTNVMQGYSAFDLHLIDLAKVPDVIAAVDNFTAAVQANPDANLLAIGRARDNAQVFSVDDPDAARYFSSVDLVDFMRRLQDMTEDEALKEAAQAVIDTSLSSVVYGSASAALPGSTGMGIYFPANQDDYAIGGNDGRYPSEAAGNVPSWLAFLGTFYGTATETFQPQDLTIQIDAVIPGDGTASIWDPPVILFTINGSGIVDIQFFAALKIEGENMAILLDASALVFSYYNEEGEYVEEFPEGESPGLQFAWNVEMPLMSDAAGNSEITVLISNSDNPGEATVSGLYHPVSGEPSRAYLVVDTATRKVTQVYGIQESPAGQAVGEIQPRNGDEFEPQYRVLDETGEIQLIESGTRLVFSDEPFSFEFVPAATGEYVFTMWVKDIAGNISLDSIEFAVNNDDLDTTYRGFKDLDMGLNFLFPWGWSDPEVTINADDSFTLATGDPTGEVRIIVDTYGVSSIDEMVQIAGETLTTFGAVFDEPQRADLTTFDEKTYEAYNVFYTYTTDDGVERAGGQLVIFVPDNGFGYIIDVDSLAERADEANAVFNDILATLYFFPPLE